MLKDMAASQFVLQLVHAQTYGSIPICAAVGACSKVWQQPNLCCSCCMFNNMAAARSVLQFMHIEYMAAAHFVLLLVRAQKYGRPSSVLQLIHVQCQGSSPFCAAVGACSKIWQQLALCCF